SAVFFTLGYVMARNQYAGQVRAETSERSSDLIVNSRQDVAAKETKDLPQVEPATDPVTPPSSSWELYHAGESKAADEHLEPARVKGTAGKTVAAVPAKNSVATENKPAATSSVSKTVTLAPQIPHGAFAVQVAAFTKQGDALTVAQTLQKKKFPAYV